MKWIFITGVSSGLGEECCKQFLENGYRVFGTLRDLKKIPSWVGDLPEDARASLHLLELNLTNLSSLEEIGSKIDRILQSTNGKLVALINNAGICVTGPLELLSPDQLREQMEVNWLAPIILTQRLLPLLRLAQGKVINMGSAAGRIALPYLSAYASSKFAMEAWSDSLRREVRGQGVSVVLLEVGSIQTPIWEKLNINAQEHLVKSLPTTRVIYEKSLKKFLDLNVSEAKRRKTRPSDVAKTIVFMLPKTRVPARIVIGSDARLVSLVSRIMPDSILDLFICRSVRVKENS
jgi:short-subunit dehydrogenase